MIRIASEDIGMAEPNALRMVISAKDAFTTLGSPEESSHSTRPRCTLHAHPRATPSTWPRYGPAS